MLIAQISDTHILARTSDAPAVQLRAECLRRCVADINRHRPDAVVFTGDTVQHGQPDEYAHLRELLAPLKAPLYLVPGNRDDKQAQRSAFDDATYLSTTDEFLNYTIEDYDVRLVGLDSTLAGERKGRFCEQRQAWLDADAQRTTGSPDTVVYSPSTVRRRRALHRWLSSRCGSRGAKRHRQPAVEHFGVALRPRALARRMRLGRNAGAHHAERRR